MNGLLPLQMRRVELHISNFEKATYCYDLGGLHFLLPKNRAGKKRNISIHLESVQGPDLAYFWEGSASDGITIFSTSLYYYCENCSFFSLLYA